MSPLIKSQYIHVNEYQFPILLSIVSIPTLLNQIPAAFYTAGDDVEYFANICKHSRLFYRVKSNIYEHQYRDIVKCFKYDISIDVHLTNCKSAHYTLILELSFGR